MWNGIFLGVFLAFYAYIGFEDMVTVAEETKEPTRTVPLAILLAVGISTLLYMLVALAAAVSAKTDSLKGASQVFGAVVLIDQV